jgi:aminopeptidase N
VIVDHAPTVGYALETQTRPIFDRAPDEITLSHEIAHQWFGDSVSLERWQDMWLNEGFATWAEWRWDQERGGRTTAQRLTDLEAQPPSRTDLWDPPANAIPNPSELFATAVYTRGAMALEALRQRVGDPTFYDILSTWAAQHAYLNADTADFIALAEEKSGLQLDDLFNKYLFKQGKP